VGAAEPPDDDELLPQADVSRPTAAMPAPIASSRLLRTRFLLSSVVPDGS